MPLEFTLSQRGKPKLKLEGFTYYKLRHNEKSSITTWRCDQRPCKATVNTCSENILERKYEHDHASVPHMEEVVR